ncbi:MAG: L-lactate permease [Lactobacillaceae bacterium]|jgi:lactate permease|nr:L-lactate permease [Lactobacillaceae bacterium]
MIIIALLAVILPLILLAFMNLPAAKGMAISSAVVLVAAYFIWHVKPIVLGASILQGIHKTIPILWILFGALMMLEVLRYTGAIQRINEGFQALTSDVRILIIVIAYLFGGLIEGVSGFGTPAMVTAPLMIALGFNPMAAVTIALVSDSTTASFGAVGTPLTVGLSNVATGPDFINHIGQTVVALDLTAGTFMPLILIFMLTRFFGDAESKNKGRDLLEMAPWALFIGVLYSLVAIASVNLVGYEFTSILTPLVMLVVAMVTIKFNFLLPKTVRENPWRAALKVEKTGKTPKTSMSLLTAWAPYLLVVILLLLSRTVAPLKAFLTTYVDLSWTHILGLKTISSDWQFLYSPGTILTVAALLGLLIQVRSIKPFAKAAKSVGSGMGVTGFTLCVTLIMVQVFSNSGFNTAQLASMPTYIAETISQYTAGVWVFIAPFLGELGAFITGSATVSTLTFSPIQFDVAKHAHLNVNVILAAQVIGAAAGNMICVHNIVAASAVVGLGGNEGAILRKTILPAVIYGVLLGITGFVWLAWLT